MRCADSRSGGLRHPGIGISAGRRSCERVQRCVVSNSVRRVPPSLVIKRQARICNPRLARLRPSRQVRCLPPGQRSYGFFVVVFPRTLPSQNINPPPCVAPSRAVLKQRPGRASRRRGGRAYIANYSAPLRGSARAHAGGGATRRRHPPCIHPSIHPSSAEKWRAVQMRWRCIIPPRAHPVSGGRNGTFRPPVVCSAQNHISDMTRKRGNAVRPSRRRRCRGRPVPADQPTV